jgi:hypothetical protein
MGVGIVHAKVSVSWKVTEFTTELLTSIMIEC